MKLHLGSDQRTLVHSVRTNDAGAADITQLLEVLHGREREAFGRPGLQTTDPRWFFPSFACRPARIESRAMNTGQRRSGHRT
jgi:hypothetical protein